MGNKTLIVDDNAHIVLTFAKEKAKLRGISSPTFSDAIRELATNSKFSATEIQQFVQEQLKKQNTEGETRE